MLLKRCQDAGLAVVGTLEQEVEAHERLAGAGRSGDERHCAGPIAIAERFVECRYPGRDALRAERVARRVVFVSEARKDGEAVGADAVRVLPGPEAAAAKFEHLEHAQFALGGAVGMQRDDRIGNGELRSVRRLVAVVFADPERGRGDSGQSPGQVVQEAPEVCFVGGEGSECFEAVDDDVARLLLLEDHVDLVDHTGKSVAGDDLAEVVVEDRCSDRIGVEERH